MSRRAGANSADALIVQNLGWEIECIEKLQRRSQGEPFSVWRVVFTNIKDKSRVILNYQVEHVATTDAVGVLLARNQRYREGSTCVVKTWNLLPDQLVPAGIPRNLLAKYMKSDQAVCEAFERDIVDRQRNRLTTGLDYLRANNVPAYAFKSMSAGAGKAAQTKRMVLMAKLGAGRDLMDCLLSEADGAANRLTEDAFNKVFMRLLARVVFFHSSEKRPILDLKPENMIPIFDERGTLIDIQLIDYESSLGNRFLFTTSMMSLKSAKQCIGLLQRHGNQLPLPAMSQLYSVDYDALANLYSKLYAHFVSSAAFSVGFQYCDFQLGRRAMCCESEVLPACPDAAREIYKALLSVDPFRDFKGVVFVRNPELKHAFVAVFAALNEWFKRAPVKPARILAKVGVVRGVAKATTRKRPMPGALVETEAVGRPPEEKFKP